MMKKKILAIFLAGMMVCSAAPAEVLAAGTEMQTEENQEQEEGASGEETRALDEESSETETKTEESATQENPKEAEPQGKPEETESQEQLENTESQQKPEVSGVSEESQEVSSQNVPESAENSGEVSEPEEQKASGVSEKTEEGEKTGKTAVEKDKKETKEESEEVQPAKAAPEETERNLPTGGLEELKMIQMPEQVAESVQEIDSTKVKKNVDGVEVYDVPALGSQAYDSSWDIYSSNYIYNRLNSGEKKYWDALDVIGRYYLTKNTNALIYNSETAYPSAMVSYGKCGLSLEEAGELMIMFMYSNPQYYFFDNQMLYSRSSEQIIPTMYREFAYGSDRAVETSQVNAKIKSWEAAIAKGKNDVEKAKIAHDLIIEKVMYDPGFESNNPTTPYHQSAYSVFCDDYTVCAGYTKAFEILMNGAGVDTIGVTSKTHAWNQISINDSWYNLDCTWDDFDGEYGLEVVYTYFNRSEKMITGALDMGSASHQLEAMYAGLVPKTTLDSGAGKTPADIGTYKAPVSTTATPKISQNKSSTKGIKVTIKSFTPGAEIYYTLDGSNPSSSYSRSYRYTKPFTVSSNGKLKAIAVCDTKWDSKIATASVYGKVCTIKFDSKKGSKVSAQKVYRGNAIKKPSNPKRSGYVFGGWYKDKNCKKAWNFKTKITGNTTLYAKWGKKYTVKFNANSGSLKTKSKSVGYALKYGTLPSPAKKGYAFAGWYTKKSGGSRVTDSSTVKIKKTTTLYAHWKKISVGKTTMTGLKNNASGKIAVTFRKVSGVSGYEIAYSMKSNMKSAKIMRTTAVSKKIGGVVKGKRYYVRVRAYKTDSAGKRIYGKWSAVKNVRVTK